MIDTLQRFLAAAPAGGEPAMSVFEVVVKGGWVMAPIGICSLIALAIIVERAVTLRKARVAPPGLVEAVRPLRRDPERALETCDASPLARVIAAAIKARNEPAEVRDRRVEEAARREIGRLRKGLRLLSAIPQTATMLGLLGTVIGMIRTFTVIAASGESLGKTERLAKGIYEAWTATAAGLAVAIPALIAYQLLLAKLDGAAAALDESMARYLDDDPAPHAARREAAESLDSTPVVVG